MRQKYDSKLGGERVTSISEPIDEEEELEKMLREIYEDGKPDYEPTWDYDEHDD